MQGKGAKEASHHGMDNANETKDGQTRQKMEGKATMQRQQSKRQRGEAERGPDTKTTTNKEGTQR